jgi:hypothetical protein
MPRAAISTPDPLSHPQPARAARQRQAIPLPRRLERAARSATHHAASAVVEVPAPDVLSETDLELAAWLAGVAANHPDLENATEPLSWPAAAREKLEQLISDYRDDRRGLLKPRPRSLTLRLASQIHELFEELGCHADIADAIILDDDREWQRLYAPKAVR